MSEVSRQFIVKHWTLSQRLRPSICWLRTPRFDAAGEIGKCVSALSIGNVRVQRLAWNLCITFILLD
jgi:hypothetical protein